MSPRHRHLEVQSIRLHIVEDGPADGPAILFLHGFPEFWYGWHRQLPFFAEAGYRVIAPDQRGYNLSDKPGGIDAYKIDTLAGDAVGLLDALNIEQAFLVGHDWGGFVAWWAAASAPERFPRVAILNVPHPLVMRRFLKKDKKQRRRSWYMFFFQLPWLPEFWYRRRNFLIGERSIRGTARRGTFTDDDMTAYREAWQQPGALKAMIHWYRASMRRRPASQGAMRIPQPTLLLWGLRDRFLSRRMIAPSLEFCDDGQLQEIPRATHWVHHEEPDEINRALADFFAG
jgi:pimeloyl-ACP methyl ester carboxylesterase